MADENYLQKAENDAKDTVENFLDEIVELLIDKGEASSDLGNDYSGGDSYHHESHVDRDYSLLEAAELLDELSDYEETDSGLWEDQEPRRAIATQAAYTYGNAVMSEWNDLIEEINDEASAMAAELEENRNELLARQEELEEKEGRSPEEEKELDGMDDRLERFDGARKHKLKNEVLRVIGRRKSAGKGPKEWMP